MGVLVISLGLLVIQFFTITESSPGTWVGESIQNDEIHDFSRNGWSPKNQRSIIFYLQACGDTIISLNVDDATYVKIYLGNSDNTYVLGIPNSACDDTGACNITSYALFTLACESEYLWITWDLDGNVAFGAGTELNENTMLTINGEGLREEANYLTVQSLHLDGATMYIHKDYPPQFVAPAPDGTTSVTLEETASPDLLVYSITTTDPEGDSVVALVWDLTDLFTFNGTDLYTLKPLDYEAACVYVLTIGISDNNPLNVVNTTLAVYVNNGTRPTLPMEMLRLESSPVTLVEETPIGSFIDGGFTVSGAKSVLSYSLLGEDTDYISIDNASGSLVLIARLDRDGQSGVTSLDDLTLTVTDATGQNVSVDLNITVLDINDNPPLCDATEIIVKISENIPEDVFVANVSCNNSDSDGEDAVDVYLMSSADPPRFKVSGHQLFTGQEALDYESTSDWLIINMIAVDNPGGDVRLSSTLTLFVKVLPVNEYDPEWKGVDENGRFSDVSISENILPGHKVTTISATDRDVGDDGHVTYGIESIESDTGVRMDNTFTINPNTGELTTSSQLDSDPSTGGVSWFDITVSAADSFSSSSRRSISAIQRVLLENHNDLAPVFSQQVSRVDVSCGILAASPLLSLSAGDGDSASVEYSLQTGPDPFIRVDVTGDVVLLDYPDGSDVSALAQSVVVEATDRGSPEMKGTCTLLVLFEKCLSSTEPTLCQCNSSSSTDCLTTPPDTSTPGRNNATTCECDETDAARSPQVEGFLEAWVMRFAVMSLSAACLASLVIHCRKPNMPSSNKVSQQSRRMEHKEATRSLDQIERH